MKFTIPGILSKSLELILRALEKNLKSCMTLTKEFILSVGLFSRLSFEMYPCDTGLEYIHAPVVSYFCGGKVGSSTSRDLPKIVVTRREN